MDQSVQNLYAGRLQTVFDIQENHFKVQDFLSRLWSKDSSLWLRDDSRQLDIPSNLAWLDFPGTLEPLFAEISRVTKSSLDDGILDLVFLALGSSSLAVRSLLPLLSLQEKRRLFILDSSHPSSILRVQKQLDLLHAGFILANKSGDQLEDHALFLHFHHLLQSCGVPQVNQHFVSLSESNSFLSGVSRGNTFRASFLDPPHVLSSYCSLLHFGAPLVAFSGMDSTTTLSPARAMRESCSMDSDQNPALQLALFLASAALAPCRYLVFLSSPLLEPYSNRLGHLIGGSLAQGGSPLIPICGTVPHFTQPYEDNAAFVFLTIDGERDQDLQDKMSAFRASGIPFVHIHISSALQLLPESFKWEIATALVCAGTGLNPFDWPDARYPRRIAMQYLDSLSFAPDVLARTPRVQESGIQLFAEGHTRSEISTFNLTESFRSFFRLHHPEGFFVLLAFLDRTPAVESALHKIRDQITCHLGVPVFLAYGPRCFDQYAYLCRSGLPHHLSIVLTADYPADTPIPGASYSFSQLHSALCLGEFDCLASMDRHAVRVNLTGGVHESLANLEHLLQQALPRSR